jgi:apolipoprotein N-acyltransferase
MKKRLSLYLGIGFIYSFCCYYWIFYTLYKFGEMNIALTISLSLLFIVSVDIFQFGGVYLLQKIYNFNIYMFPISWISVEYLREFFPFDGFPWYPIGTIVVHIPLFKYLLAFVGVYGVGLLMMYVFIAFKSKKQSIIVLSILLTLGAVSYFYKEHVKSFYQDKKSPIKVAVIQPDIKENIKLNYIQFEKESLVYFPLLEKAISQKSNLVVLPESAFPFLYSDYEDPVRELFMYYISKNEASKIGFVVGLVDIRYKNNKPLPTNSAYSFYNGNMIDYYSKIKLLPFGEYMPYPFKFAKRFFEAINGIDFVPGKSQKPINVEIDNKIYKAAVPICFELDFSSYVRTLAKHSDFIINLTNDDWFGPTLEPYEHNDQAIARAIENGAYLIRANNSGISAIISPLGEEKTLGVGKKGVLTGYIKPYKINTPFDMYGYKPLILVIFGANIFYFYKFWAFRKRHQNI